MGGSSSPETPIPDTPTDRHLSRLDRTTQICLELLALSFMLNPGQLGSPEIPMHVDQFCRWISAADIKTSPARLTCDRTRDSPALHLWKPISHPRVDIFFNPHPSIYIVLNIPSLHWFLTRNKNLSRWFHSWQWIT
jgi:hypothetical protein